MRSVLMLVLGIIIGAVGATMALRALSEGSEYPRGVMAIMGVHFGELRKVAESGECDADRIASHAATLRQVANDIEPAFLRGDVDDAVFREHAALLRERIGALEAAVGQGCPALAEANAAMGEACKACHQDYR